MAFIFYHFFVNLATVCRSILFCFVLQSLKYWHLQAIFINGSKACAWLIYKSAAPLTARLTPRRHPLAALAGAEAKRTPQRANKPKTETKERRRRGIAAEPLGDCRAHLSPRTAFFQSVLYRYCFNRFRVRRAFVMSLSATALSPLCRSTVLCILHLSSTRNHQRV